MANNTKPLAAIYNAGIDLAYILAGERIEYKGAWLIDGNRNVVFISFEEDRLGGRGTLGIIVSKEAPHEVSKTASTFDASCVAVYRVDRRGQYFTANVTAEMVSSQLIEYGNFYGVVIPLLIAAAGDERITQLGLGKRMPYAPNVPYTAEGLADLLRNSPPYSDYRHVKRISHDKRQMRKHEAKDLSDLLKQLVDANRR